MVSVIIPVFNRIKTLKRCVDSVLSQTYSDLEIILVDDESTDSSEKLCDDYPERDSRVSVIHLKNEGVASARNHGIENAKGEYITFIDSDDYIAPEYIEKLVSAIEEDCILAMCNYYDVNGDALTKRSFSREGKCSAWDFIDDSFYCRAEGGFCWGKIFRTKDIKTLFRDYKYCEDVFFIFDFLTGSEGYVSIVPDYLYYYVRHENSITGTKKLSDFKDVIYVCEGIREVCNARYPKIIASADAHLVNCAFFVYLNIKDDKCPEGENLRELSLKTIKKYRGIVFRDTKSTIKTKTACLISFISFGLLRFIYGIINK